MHISTTWRILIAYNYWGLGGFSLQKFTDNHEPAWDNAFALELSLAQTSSKAKYRRYTTPQTGLKSKGSPRDFVCKYLDLPLLVPLIAPSNNKCA